MTGKHQKVGRGEEPAGFEIQLTFKCLTMLCCLQVLVGQVGRELQNVGGQVDTFFTGCMRMLEKVRYSCDRILRAPGALCSFSIHATVLCQ